ncbi:DUF4230 domain-containing protein [Acidobacterium sp. S8]|uniref:DUF4230 domain-containing protein n=1 Tax=Acidobacterium sp. S8 TaxID=1641854 RepID=UPI00131DC727|nr:DUF4230 domain-containing protein [Acidobacterium sp. S8]
MSTPVLTPVEPPKRSSIGKILLSLFLGLVIGAIALVLFIRHATEGAWNEFAAKLTHRSLSVDTSLPTIVAKIQQLQRLETVVYTMDKVVGGSRESEYFPDFLAGDKLLLVVHGQTIAGIDLSKLQSSDIKINGRAVQVHLPQSEVFTTTLDNSKTRVYSRETGLFAAADPNLESEVRDKAQQELQQAAVNDGILQTARKNAAATVTTMLLGLGFEHVEVD